MSLAERPPMTVRPGPTYPRRQAQGTQPYTDSTQPTARLSPAPAWMPGATVRRLERTRRTNALWVHDPRSLAREAGSRAPVVSISRERELCTAWGSGAGADRPALGLPRVSRCRT